MDEATQRELNTFVEQEQAKAKLQSSTHTFTEMCWNKCITGSISSRFSKSEESCLVNCVDRFLDTSLHIVKALDHQRQQMQPQ
ncbi:hypothetical protein E3P92_00313 [Wallemia ichthyophaga]|uniref:Mitochondrial import inner membrane translocase subunit n=2 Tax=Wallemia ichthyophaga TaxID=245174 RepID=A0A4T0JC33_WALIC|nr:uncharacterized protein J056_004685 [Wallemia ichthyophaga EXF-994]TIA70164.1 hypothetical protein E3P91_03250 [Wallemia ichthyophaga]EOR00873.1 hypothetical protein J056_004685 [Wallemia ichthyophaga EXF-994]TIA80787.1 hypothetical protein E3P98_02504 [Wallemia ichthyophaga]TIA89616.1 hypothetical protein E3P97_02943 [Wallemia ichthyophaga]TIB03868.1 hypothetical protein E3P95_00378 [Wallemia ichthyophaga]